MAIPKTLNKTEREIEEKILEIARLANDVTNSDLQGIAMVEARKIYQLVKEEGKMKKTCVICGGEIKKKYGNNPYPVKNDGECCDICNIRKVIPARIKALYRKETGGQDASKRA